MSGNGSGDIFIAFSTANPGAFAASGVGAASRCCRTRTSRRSSTPRVQATEEAIVNALVAADTMTGVDNHRVIGLPHDRAGCARCSGKRPDRLVNPGFLKRGDT